MTTTTTRTTFSTAACSPRVTRGLNYKWRSTLMGLLVFDGV